MRFYNLISVYMYNEKPDDRHNWQYRVTLELKSDMGHTKHIHLNFERGMDLNEVLDELSRTKNE